MGHIREVARRAGVLSLERRAAEFDARRRVAPSVGSPARRTVLAAPCAPGWVVRVRGQGVPVSPPPRVMAPARRRLLDVPLPPPAPPASSDAARRIARHGAPRHGARARAAPRAARRGARCARRPPRLRQSGWPERRLAPSPERRPWSADVTPQRPLYVRRHVVAGPRHPAGVRRRCRSLPPSSSPSGAAARGGAGRRTRRGRRPDAATGRGCA